MLKRRKIDKDPVWIWWTVFLIIAALYTCLAYITPLYLDDWRFMAEYRDNAPSPSLSMQGLWNYYTAIRGYDNGRIANLLSPLSTMFTPFRQLFPIITGCGIAYIIYVACRVAQRGRENYSLLFPGLSWTLLLLLLPWRDTLFVADYSLNYIWTAAITLLFLQFLCKTETRGFSYRIIIPGLIIAILAGGWHESFALTTCLGLLLVAIKRRFRLSQSFYILAAIYFFSALIFAFTPPIINRFRTEVSNDVPLFTLKSVANYAAGILLILMAMILSLRKDFIPQIREFLKRSSSVLFIGIAVSGYALAFSVIPTPRSFFWPDLACVILITSLIYSCFKLDSDKWMGLKNSIGVLLICLCMAQTVYAIVWQLRYNREYDDIMSQIKISESGTVFHDIIQPRDLPYATLKIPVQEAWTNPVYYHSLRTYFEKPFIAVVPVDLRQATMVSTSSLSGNLSAGRSGNYIIAPYNGSLNKPDWTPLKYTFKDGRSEKETTFTMPFVTASAKPDTLIYFRIPDIPVSEIVGIDLTD